MNIHHPADEQLRKLAEQRLEVLRTRQRYRSLRARDDALIDLNSNDYLGLARLSWFQEAVRERCRLLPVGAGGSRLLGGEHAIFAELETRFARFKGSQAALLFPTGYHANEGVITAIAQLAGASIEIFSDRLNHASIIDGLRLTGLSSNQRTIFAHHDLKDLASKLEASTASIKVVVSETVFSMDGDRIDVGAMRALCQRYGASLVLDEAHAIYALDHSDLESGRGLADGSIITINPCGKALGAAGALLAGPQWLREVMINLARPFIYSTATSPWVAAALLVALEEDHAMRARRRRLHQLAQALRQALAALDFDTGASTTAIVPVIAQSDERAVLWSRFLEQHGILVRPIRPPTVPDGTARLRLSLSASLSDLEMERIIGAFVDLRQTL